MYQVLMQHMDPKYHGLVGYKPDMANKRQVPSIYRRLGGKPDPNNADVILVPRPVLMEIGESVGRIPLTDENWNQAKVFLKKKWTERYQDRNGADKSPKDMSGSCKFVSLFVQKVFGGQIRGNHGHQFNVIGDKIRDMNADAGDVQSLENPHEHDPKFWGNPEHRASMKTCMPRVNQWVEEFTELMQMVESTFSGEYKFLPDEPDEDLEVSAEDQISIKQSAKAPSKVVKANVRALSARGKPARLNPYKLKETIRKPFQGSLTNEYEIMDDCERTVGYASVVEGVIDDFQFDESGLGLPSGTVASMMLHQIVGEADRHSANLSIQIVDLSSEIKLIFERFGFRLVTGDIMKRLAGSIRPTSVVGTPGMSD
jgi:hypothetical protein